MEVPLLYFHADEIDNNDHDNDSLLSKSSDFLYGNPPIVQTTSDVD